jgi:hypothetical protein
LELSSSKEAKRAKLILDLQKYRIPTSILEYVAEKVRSPIKLSGQLLKVYESLNDKALDILHRAFVKCEVDRPGRFLELRLANYMMKQIKEIDKVDFRKKLIGASKAIHEIDIVGYDEKGAVLAIGESKARIGASTKDHVTKWLKEVEDIAKNEDYENLEYVYFMSLGGYTDDAIKMAKDLINKEGKYRIKLGLLSWHDVYLSFLEEREGKICKVLPK